MWDRYVFWVFGPQVYSLVEFVGDQLLLSVVEETAPFIPKPAHGNLAHPHPLPSLLLCSLSLPLPAHSLYTLDTISECKQKLKVLCEDVKQCVKRLGEPLVKAVKVLIEAAKTYVQGKPAPEASPLTSLF